MLKIKKISEAIGKHVYTSEGEYFGQIEEVNLIDNKIDGWRIKVGTGFAGVLGGARGVVIPHQFVKSMGDVIIVNKASFPNAKEDSVMPSVSPDSSGMTGSDISL